MSKELPRVFANKIDKRLDNNKEYNVSKNDEIKTDEKKEYKGIPIGKNINQKINEIFSSYKYVYKADVIITTDDGSIGYKGNVLEYLKENKVNFDYLYACGPLIVLKNLDLKYRDVKEGYLSFESRMACGIGACYGCVINTKNGLKRVCKDGPIFKLGEVIYD